MSNVNVAEKPVSPKSHEIEVIFVLNTIAKCLRTEPKIAETKTLQVYRKLSGEAMQLLIEKGYTVATFTDEVEGQLVTGNRDGVYCEVSWK